jgi:hypothetical protein
MDDRSGAFEPYTLAADLLEVREIYAGHFERFTADDWARPTERRPEAWTLHETVAHLAAVAIGLNQAIDATLEGTPGPLTGRNLQRSDLKTFNREALDALAPQTSADLVALLLDAMSAAARTAARLEASTLATPVEMPFYHTNPTIAQMLGIQLVHPGLVHGAQVAVGQRAQPIWNFYRPGLMRRQLTRFFMNMALVYWPERAGDLHATISFTVNGKGGGSWYISVAPELARAYMGKAEKSTVALTFASAELFCKALTYRTSLWRNVLLRRIRVSGDLGLARSFPRYFLPT